MSSLGKPLAISACIILFGLGTAQAETKWHRAVITAAPAQPGYSSYVSDYSWYQRLPAAGVQLIKHGGSSRHNSGALALVLRQMMKGVLRGMEQGKRAPRPSKPKVAARQRSI